MTAKLLWECRLLFFTAYWWTKEQAMGLKQVKNSTKLKKKKGYYKESAVFLE